jgi:hypothetical protein
MFSQGEKTELSAPAMVEVHDEATELFVEPPIYARPSSSDQFAAALGSNDSRPGTPFPIAPPEWLPRDEPELPSEDSFNQFRNRVLLIGGIAMVVILGLSLVFGK